MFSWYRKAGKCYVYLSDAATPGDQTTDRTPQRAWESAFRSSRWFARGWTLQELVAPRLVEFFLAHGVRLGDKKSLEALIHEITGIPLEALRGADMATFSVAERMSWANNRRTKRREDRAYSLLGIFNVFLPLMYGDGDHAFLRLQNKIEKRQADGTKHNDLLKKLPVVDQGAFNSYDNQHAPTCLPNTRVELLRDVTAWVDGPDQRSVFWLNGTAGTGKSTVARTIASTYHGRGNLGGSFFFSRGGGGLSRADRLICLAACDQDTTPQAVHLRSDYRTRRYRKPVLS
jgi:hypothetical protein